MNNICVCIEGELRGYKNCGPTIKKNLIEHLNANLYFCLQKTSDYNEDNLSYYGNYKELLIYENPTPNFKDTFNNLCKDFDIDENKWEKIFDILIDDNYKLGYDKPGTCIRRMYNRYLIYKMLVNTNYEWFIILRSDLYFNDLFYSINYFDKGVLTISKNYNWSRCNNNMMIFDRSIFENVLLYIKNFLNNNLLNFIINNNILDVKVNEEIFFIYNMLINNVNINKIHNKWYISADNINDNTTWGTIKESSEGHLFKYEDDYDNSRKIYYSKNNEDEYYIKNIINYKKNGIFLDIGAYDGITYSNTYYLESILGWSGICVEPYYINIEKCKKNRKTIICNKIIYEKSDIDIDLIMLSNNNNNIQLGNINGQLKITNLDISKYSNIDLIKVNTININDLLNNYNIHNIDYMSINAYSYELNILKMIDYDKNIINYINVIHNEIHQQDIYDFLITKSYKRHKTNKLNDEYILDKTILCVKSFNIFDTLIARKMKHPTDLFKMIEEKYKIKNFYNNRINAEKISNGTFNDIYNKFQQITKLIDNDILILKNIEIQMELDNIIPIQSNIEKINDGDILVSDMYLPEHILYLFLEKININKKIKIYVTPNSKYNGYIWNFLLTKYNIIEHIGDNLHSDIKMAQLHNINARYTQIYKFSLLENILPINLANIIREFRLLNHYNENSIEYYIYNKQCNSNIIILCLLSVQLHNIMQTENRNRMLLCTCYCCLLVKILNYFYPQYEYITYHTSRLINQNYNEEYKNYVKQIYDDNSIIIDLNGSFNINIKLYLEIFGKLPRVHLLNYNINSSLFDGLTYSTDKMRDYIEELNYDTIGTMIDFKNDEVIRLNNDKNLTYIQISHNTIDSFITFIKNKNLYDILLFELNNINDNNIDIKNLIFSNTFFN